MNFRLLKTIYVHLSVCCLNKLQNGRCNDKDNQCVCLPLDSRLEYKWAGRSGWWVWIWPVGCRQPHCGTSRLQHTSSVHTALFSLKYLYRDIRTCTGHFAMSVVIVTSSDRASVITNSCTFWQNNTSAVTTHTEFSVSSGRLRAVERTTSMLRSDRRCCPLYAVLSLVFRIYDWCW